MNELREVSNGVLAKGDNTLKAQKDRQFKEEQEHQLRAKKHSISIREIPDEFIDIMQKAHNNVFLVIDVESDDYQTAKKLTNLFWIRAVKNKGNKVIFKETKLGKKIMNTLKPQKRHNSKLDDWGIFQLFLGICISAISGMIAIIVSNPAETSSASYIPFGYLFILGIVIMLLSSIPITIGILYPYLVKSLTVGNCTKVAKKVLNKHDIRFEHEYLIKYSEKHVDFWY